MFARTWEFESPLRHHKKINGLEEFNNSSDPLFFAPTPILPHFAPTFVFFSFFLCLTLKGTAVVCSRTLGAFFAFTASLDEYFSAESSLAQSSTSSVSPSPVLYPELPQAVFATRLGGVLFLRLSPHVSINTRRNTGEVFGVAVTWWSRPDEPAALNPPQTKGILLRKNRKP